MRFETGERRSAGQGLVRGSPDEFTELTRIPAFNSKTWNHAVIASDILLVHNDQEMAAFRFALARRCPPTTRHLPSDLTGVEPSGLRRTRWERNPDHPELRAETLNWLDKYVKNATPRSTTASAAR
jgi:hypothetical protein